MAKNQDGEFELVLGNHQLLGFFFIVMILMGVCFAMGYIVGRNSGPPTTVQVTPPHTEAKPVEASVPKHEPATSSSGEPAKTEETPAPVAPVAAKPTPSRSDEPEAGGIYLQLSAIGKAEADVMVDVLKKNKFNAIDAEIPEKAGTFRVLVGPLAEGDINKTRADLVAAGFPGDKAIKKTF